MELENVDLTLTKERILQGISLKIKPKVTSAIIGHIGAGKHQIVDLAMRICEIDPGFSKIRTVCGINPEAYDSIELRKHIVYLAEFPVLFSGTLKENIDPKLEYGDDKLIEAA